MHPYDDPYLLLAWYIASHCTMKEIAQCLTDDDWIRRQIRHECYAQDFRGPFLDTIIEELDGHNRLWLRRVLNELADALLTKLDIEKLRHNVSEITGISV